MLKQFLPTCPAPRACAVSEPVGSAVLLTGLALCQAVSRTGQNCMPPPLPPAGSLVSALDTKTNRLCALAPYSTQGRGGSSKYPSYVNNQDYLAAHLIFCKFISIKVRAFYSWEACPTLSLVPGIALVRGAQSPSWFCSSSVPSDTNCMQTPPEAGRGGIFLPCSKALHHFLFSPRGRNRKSLRWGHGKSVTFWIGTCCLDHHFILQRQRS